MILISNTQTSPGERRGEENVAEIGGKAGAGEGVEGDTGGQIFGWVASVGVWEGERVERASAHARAEGESESQPKRHKHKALLTPS